MKKLIFVCLFVFISLSSSYGQIEFGIKAGLSSYDLAKNGLIINTGSQNLEWKINKAGYGHHFGFYTRLSLLGVFVEPSFLFNSNNVSYKITQYGESGTINLLKNEKYNKLDVPVLAGFKLGFLRLQGGVIGHLHINSGSELVDFKGYEQKFKTASYGWLAGVGLDLWKLRFDLNYEGNLDKFGDHITIDGNNYSFSDSPSRYIFSLGYKF